MKTVQMTLEEDLLRRVDRAVRRLRTSRSAFTRRALRDALRRLAEEEQERRHRRGYTSRPEKRGEFDTWEREQMWPD